MGQARDKCSLYLPLYGTISHRTLPSPVPSNDQVFIQFSPRWRLGFHRIAQIRRNLKRYLVQTFMGKGAYVKTSSLLPDRILKTSRDGTPLHPWGGCCSEWLFSLWKIYFLCQDEISPSAVCTHFPLSSPCGFFFLKHSVPSNTYGDI